MKIVILSTLMLIIGCATGVTGMLRFQDRELLIHPDQPGLAYPHRTQICVDRKKPWKWLGKKCHKESRVDVYDLNDKQTRLDLINAGFTCKSAMRFKY